MSQENPFRIFVTHGWEDGDDYHRVFEYFEGSRGFYYRNTATPDHRPAGDADAAREDLRRQIDMSEVVVALASLQSKHPELLIFEMNYAKSAGKPVLLLRPFGVDRPIPKVLEERADEVGDWDERRLVDAVRRLARNETSSRYDSIDFNPEDFKLD